MLRNIAVVIVGLVSLNASAQTILLDETFTSGVPAGWQIIDADGFTPDASLSQFTDGWIWYPDSPDTTLATTSFFMDTVANAEDYVILPKQSILTHSKLSWDARSVDASYPDGYLVLLSTTDSNITSFTDTLLVVDAEYFVWERTSILLDTMGYANQDVFIAFCHHTADGYILELDNVRVEASDFTSIEEEEIALKLYPNPVQDILRVEIEDFTQLAVYHSNGQLLATSKENVLDVSDLSPGTYYAVISTSTGNFSRLFVKK